MVSHRATVGYSRAGIQDGATMASLIPTRGSCAARMTGGERRLAERLEQKLEDDYVVWYDVPIGLKQRHPDFVILHPRRGLLVLEVKDWKADTIQQADRTQFTLVTARGLVKENNPLLQARACALEVGVLLERDPALRHPEGHHYAGKLVMPWAWGCIAGPTAVIPGIQSAGNSRGRPRLAVRSQAWAAASAGCTIRSIRSSIRKTPRPRS